MERLTGKHYLVGGYYMKCTENCNGEDIDCMDCAALENLVDRLGAYEDTGLTPEDLKAAFTEETALKLCGQLLGIEPARLRELAKADKDGRLVVLPCKVGDTVFLLDSAMGRVRECEVEFVDIRRSIRTVVVRAQGDWSQYGVTFYSFGKTAFLTREEAEAALKEVAHDEL